MFLMIYGTVEGFLGNGEQKERGSRKLETLGLISLDVPLPLGSKKTFLTTQLEVVLLQGRYLFGDKRSDDLLRIRNWK